jgi:hypothetical protein
MASISRAAPLRNPASSVVYATAPAFTPEELRVIAEWSVAMRRIGVSTRFDLGHVFLTEALNIVPTGADEPNWLVHKTPKGAVAVRRWPGVADIVPTVEQALAVVAQSMTNALLPAFRGGSS